MKKAMLGVIGFMIVAFSVPAVASAADDWKFAVAPYLVSCCLDPADSIHVRTNITQRFVEDLSPGVRAAGAGLSIFEDPALPEHDIWIQDAAEIGWATDGERLLHILLLGNRGRELDALFAKKFLGRDFGVIRKGDFRGKEAEWIDWYGNLEASVLGGLGVIAAYGFLMLASLALAVYLPAALDRSALRGTVADGFAWREILGFIQANLGNYLISLVIYLLASFLSQFGLILCCVGVFPAAFWGYMVLAGALGQTVRLSAVPV